MASGSVFLIEFSSLNKPGIVFYANGTALGLTGEEETHPALAAAIVQESVFLAYKSGAGYLLQNTVVSGFIGEAGQVRYAVITASSLDTQQS